MIFLMISCTDKEDIVDQKPPVVQITQPLDGSYVDSTVQVVARATDNEFVDSIEIYIDSVLVVAVSDTIATYNWVTNQLMHSTEHSIYAIAYDSGDNAGVSDTVWVIVEHTGTLKWRWLLASGEVTSAAIGSDGTICFGISALYSSRLYALNPEGMLMWCFPSLSGTAYWGMTASAIGLNGVIYFGAAAGYPNNTLVAVHPDGTENWSYYSDHWINSSPSIGIDGTIYFAAEDRCYALHPDGTLHWYYEAGGSVETGPAISLSGDIYFGSDDRYLHALHADGSYNWRYLTGGAVVSSPAIGSDGAIYFGSNDGYLYALNPGGSLRWRFLTGGAVSASPSIGSDGTIYFGSHDRYFYALTPAGALRWRYLTGDVISSSAAIDFEGVVHFGKVGAGLAV